MDNKVEDEERDVRRIAKKLIYEQESTDNREKMASSTLTAGAVERSRESENKKKRKKIYLL